MIPPYGVLVQMLDEAAHRRLKQSQNNVKREILTSDFSQTHMVFALGGIVEVVPSRRLSGLEESRQQLRIESF